MLVSRVTCLFICPCFSNGFVLGAGAFSANVIGELLAVSVKSLVTPSISVFRSPNVCLPLPWSTRSPLFWLYCGLFGIGLECPLLFAPLDHLWWLYCGFLGSGLVLLECLFLFFAPLGHLFWLYCGFLGSELVLLECAFLPSLCSPRSPLLVTLWFFEKGLSECGSIVYALSCLICK